MERQHEHALAARRTRRVFLRTVTHTLVLVAIGAIVGLTGLTASEAAAGAASPAQPSAAVSLQSPVDIQLQVGETATLDGGALQVTLVQVTEDSRCPKDVMCVWMGRAVVALHVVLDGVDRGDLAATLHALSDSQPSDLDATVDRYVLALTDLQPYPVSSHPQPMAESVATIRVTIAP